jgi:hypothetical protein
MSENRIVARILAREIRELSADEIMIVSGGSAASHDSGSSDSSSWNSAKETGETRCRSGQTKAVDDCDIDQGPPIA